MKKFNLFAIGVVAMLMAAVSVSAASKTWDDVCTTADGKTTCTIAENVTLGSKEFDKDTTLNVNAKLTLTGTITVKSGNTLTVSGTNRIDAEGLKSNSNVIVLENGANLNFNVRLKTSDDKGSKNFSAIKVNGGGTAPSTVTLGSGARIEGYNTALGIMGDNVNAKISGTIVTTDNGVAVHGGVKLTTRVSTIDVLEGASIKSTNLAGIYAGGYAQWSISGAVEGHDGISAKSGKINVLDGSYIHATAESFTKTPTANGNGEELTGAAISITDMTGGDAYQGGVALTVSGGKVESYKGYAIYEVAKDNANSALESISIKGGEFFGAESGVVKLGTKEGLTKFVSGGEFTYTGKAEDGKSLTENYAENAVIDQGTGKTYVGTNADKLFNITTGAVDKNGNDITIKDVKASASAGSKVRLTSLYFNSLENLEDYTVRFVVYNANNEVVKVIDYKYDEDAEMDYADGEISTIADLFEMPSYDVKVAVTLYGKTQTVPAAPAVVEPEQTPTPAPGEDQGGNQGSETDDNKGDETTTQPGANNPDTLDNVTSVAAMGGISLAIAAAGIATLKKREN